MIKTSKKSWMMKSDCEMREKHGICMRSCWWHNGSQTIFECCSVKEWERVTVGEREVRVTVWYVVIWSRAMSLRVFVSWCKHRSCYSVTHCALSWSRSFIYISSVIHLKSLTYKITTFVLVIDICNAKKMKISIFTITTPTNEASQKNLLFIF